MTGAPSSPRGIIFARRVFTAAGIYGILILAPQYFMEGRLGHDFPPPVTHPEHYYGFIGVALAWQVLFLIVARDPARYRLVMIPCMLEKLAFGGAALVLYLQDRVAPVILAAGALDLLLGLLFLAAYRATAPRTASGPTGAP